MVTFVLQRTFCVLLLQIFRKNSLYDYPLVSFLHTFQCKEDTFRYFWVSKLLEIFFLFDLFWVPIPGLTIHPRACIVLHVSLIGGHRQIGACFPNPSDHRDHPGTLGLLFVKTLTWKFYKIGHFHANSWKFYPITFNQSPIPNPIYTIAICEKFHVWTTVTDCQIQLLCTWIFICKCTNLKTQEGNLVEQRARGIAKK